MKIDWIRHAKTIGTLMVLGGILALLMWFPDVGGFLAMVSVAAFLALMLYMLIYSCFSTDDGDNHGV